MAVRKARKGKGGVGWVPVILHGEQAIRCTVCEAVLPPSQWWNHQHATATGGQAEGDK